MARRKEVMKMKGKGKDGGGGEKRARERHSLKTWKKRRKRGVCQVAGGRNRWGNEDGGG